MNHSQFLPVTRKESDKLGWSQPDVIIITGDAYVDHPAFGAAVIGRILEKEGLTVCIVPQPNWKDDLRDFKKFGKPRYFFAVTGGNMDSMVNHYTAHKRLRSDDAYTPGGKAGFRPDYALTVYARIVKNLYPDTPVILGGIEASLRRLVHYDYWKDELFASVLSDTGADYLAYGMAEKTMSQVARGFIENMESGFIRSIPQMAWLSPEKPLVNGAIELPSFGDCMKNKKIFAASYKVIETQSNLFESQPLVQKQHDAWVVVNPPFAPLTTDEMDAYSDLPYTRLPHPKYNNKGGIPAYDMIRNSITIHRGCFGGCSFCSLAIHQGKFISSRSEKSILKEVEDVKNTPGFKGHISDLGGPSANMYRMQGQDFDICTKCKRPSCIFPSVCRNLNTSPEALLQVYRKVREITDIKKATIGSGVRYDMLLDKKSPYARANKKYLEELIVHHVSGRLKVAPEHSSDAVLKIMRKPSFGLYRELKAEFDATNRKFGLNQQLIPYFISSHPGSTLDNMVDLVGANRETSTRPEQVQDFMPTPMSLASVMYYTGMDPYTGEKIYVARSMDEEKTSEKFVFAYKPENSKELTNMLMKCGRRDLIARLGMIRKNSRKN